MKTKQLLLTLFMLFTIVIGYSQTSASTSGIAVQGIARNINNTARINETINFTFEIYYIDETNVPQTIYSESDDIDTDNFGVFSHIIDPGIVNHSKIANNPSWLKISAEGLAISNEKLNYVPYAISANNGVPTGSIMPFIGTTAPAGWALCDGQALPANATKLIGMLGSNNAPNLGGMFLRGTGGTGNHVGPLLSEIQQDNYKNHSHGKGTLEASRDQSLHDHQSTLSIEIADSQPGYDGDTKYLISNTDNRNGFNNIWTRDDTGAHEHTITGTVAKSTTGTTESRPINYGVNYIIKL